MTTRRVQPQLDAATLREHLATLYPLIQEGAQRGLHRGLRRLHRADVQALLDLTSPACDARETDAAFQMAALEMIYGAVVLAYTQRVEMLDALGEDTVADKTRLRRCLIGPPSAETTSAISHPDIRQPRLL